MTAFKNLAGRRFGRLIAIRPDRTGKTIRWECECDCGNTCSIPISSLSKKRPTESCGCLWKETVAGCTRTHGQSETYLYRIWTLIIQRCRNPNNPAYPRYGGRGITICDQWRESFEEFASSIGDRPSPTHSIDRINNDGNYEPGNVRWATKEEQGNNSRKNHLLAFQGVTRTISQWEKETGIPQKRILARIAQQGWSVERALTTPPRPIKRQSRCNIKV
jgi:hypothetical protein